MFTEEEISVHGQLKTMRFFTRLRIYASRFTAPLLCLLFFHSPPLAGQWWPMSISIVSTLVVPLVRFVRSLTRPLHTECRSMTCSIVVASELTKLANEPASML